MNCYDSSVTLKESLNHYLGVSSISDLARALKNNGAQRLQEDLSLMASVFIVAGQTEGKMRAALPLHGNCRASGGPLLSWLPHSGSSSSPPGRLQRGGSSREDGFVRYIIREAFNNAAALWNKASVHAAAKEKSHTSEHTAQLRAQALTQRPFFGQPGIMQRAVDWKRAAGEGGVQPARVKGKGELQKSKSFSSRNNCNHRRCQNPLDPSSRPDGNFPTGVKAAERGLEVVQCDLSQNWWYRC
eukprot:superscaffoldBa00000182_g2470